MHRGLYKCTGYAQIQVRFNVVENRSYTLNTQEKGSAIEAGREKKYLYKEMKT